jgi:hypothetical protein
MSSEVSDTIHSREPLHTIHMNVQDCLVHPPTLERLRDKGNEAEDECGRSSGQGGENPEYEGEHEKTGIYVFPPTTDEARLALADLDDVLKPQRTKGPGYRDPQLDLLTRQRLEAMQMFLWRYTDKSSPNYGSPGAWTAASKEAAHNLRKQVWLARKLQEWTHAFILDRKDLPVNCYGEWSVSLLEDEGLAEEIHLHLQGIGKDI